MAIGRWLKLPAYSGVTGERVIEEAKKAIGKARREDNKALKAEEDGKDRVKALLRGKSGKYTAKFSDTVYTQVVGGMMKTVRDDFKGYVIRRTIESRDFDGEAISGLPPHHEALLMLRQAPEEEAQFLQYTESWASQARDEKATQVYGSNSSQVSSVLDFKLCRLRCAPSGHTALGSRTGSATCTAYEHTRIQRTGGLPLRCAPAGHTAMGPHGCDPRSQVTLCPDGAQLARGPEAAEYRCAPTGHTTLCPLQDPRALCPDGAHLARGPEAAQYRCAPMGHASLCHPWDPRVLCPDGAHILRGAAGV